LRLAARQRVAQAVTRDRLAEAQVRAAQHVTAAARRARRASDRARHQHAITRTEAGDRTTDLDHLADGLMAEAITGVGTEAVTVLDLQVTAADAGGGDAHDRAVPAGHRRTGD